MTPPVPPPLPLRHEQETMLMTLYLHTRDAEASHPILGDPLAADLLRRVDHDPAAIRHMDGNLQ